LNLLGALRVDSHSLVSLLTAMMQYFHSKVTRVSYPTLGAPNYSLVQWKSVWLKKEVGWDRILRCLLIHRWCLLINDNVHMGKNLLFQKPVVSKFGLIYSRSRLICQNFGLFVETTGFETTGFSPYRTLTSETRTAHDRLFRLHVYIYIYTHIYIYNTIQYNTIQYNTIQYNTIQYNTI
jgi:hypothetical protein